MLRKPLEAVTVCIGYGDFLSEIVKTNAHLYDKWVIVTSKKDEETLEICRKNSLIPLISEDGDRDAGDNGNFCKGRLIERGLNMLSANGWRVHQDADIALPQRARHFLEIAELCEDTIYGIDRLMCKSWEDWKKLLYSGYLQNEHHRYHNTVHIPEGFTIGSRWADYTLGYVPIGFFQLWHSSQDQWRGTRIKPYPQKHNTAARTDVQFALQWDRNKRALIPEILGVHLESSRNAPLGVNWKGRKTPRFGPPPIIQKEKSCS
jgi:hypothetical protein